MRSTFLSTAVLVVLGLLLSPGSRSSISRDPDTKILAYVNSETKTPRNKAPTEALPSRERKVFLVKMNTPRAKHTATELPDGRVLIVGGLNEGGALASAELFNPHAKKFTETGHLAVARYGHTAALLPDGRVLIAGGRNGDSPLDSTEIFDPVTNSFLRGPSLNLARAGHSATRLADGRILIVGGDAEGSAEIFDPTTQSFALVEARLGIPRAFHAAVQLQSGKVLIAGGLAPDGNAIRSAELLDLETMEFSPTGNSMHSARVLPTLRVLPDGKVQVIGGDPEPSMEMFNPEGKYFTAQARLLSGSMSLLEVLQIQTGAALFGKPTTPDAEWQRELSGNLEELLDRSEHTLTEMLQSNQALVAGGVNSRGQVLGSAFLLTDSQPTVTTDKTDYSPGETVHIFGSGFAPGPITLTVTRPDGQVDTIPNVEADSDGKFTATYQLNGIEGTYTVRATDSLGQTAQTTFTDTSSQITQIGFNTVNQPASFTVGVPNGTSTPLRVQAQNSGGTGETVTGGGQSITIQVTSNSATGRFDTSPGGTFTATSLTLQITQGNQNTPDFFYRDTTAGMVTLTATVTAKTNQLTNLSIGSTAMITKTVNKANTTTTVTSSLNPSCEGQSVTFTATVAHATAGGAGTPTGTVTFKDGAVTLGTGTLSGGVATFSTSLLTAGAHSITAVYGGDSNFNGSTSSAITQNVTATPTCSISGPDPVCPNSSGHTYTATSSLSGSSFSWAISGNGSIVGSTTGSSVTVNAGAAGSFTLTVTVSKSGCSSTCMKTVTVADTTPPTITCPANVTVQCDADVPPADFAGGTASDNCGTPTVVHVSDVASGTCPKIITRTYKATDASGNMATCTQTITVKDTTPPVLSGCPANASFQCISQVPSPPTVTATDNCDGPVAVMFSETQSNPGSSCNNVITRTWTATDACGNTASCSQTITVNDTTAPTITTCPAAQSAFANGGCQAAVPNFTSGVVASDNCTPSGSLMITQSPAAGTMVGLGTHTITLTVKDACNNSSTCTTTFTVTDNTPPTITITTPPNGATYIVGQAVTANYSCSDNCSVATCGGTVANGANIDTSTLGVKSFTVNSTDGSGNSASKTHYYTVSPIPTTTTAAVSPTMVQYSDQVMLSATVAPTCVPCTSVGGALTGTVEFRLINGSTSVVVASGVPINGSGVASTTVAILNAGPGTYTVKAIFTSTNPNYAGSMSSGPMLTIIQEDAQATYTGTTFAFASGGTTVIALSATVKDITAVDPDHDPYAGDIRNATVKFVNRDAGNAVLCTAPVGLVNSSDPKIGVATCNWTANIGNADGVAYNIGIIVEGYYTRNSSDDNVIVNVSKPLGSFITGGGYLIMQSPAGQYAGDPGSKNNFGFNVKYNKSGTNLKGNANIIVRTGGRVYQIKSNAINSLAADPVTGKAEFNAKANLQDITDPNSPIPIDGNATLILKMTDKGEPGSSDTIGITLLSKQGGLYFSSNWDRTKTVEQMLAGGNLVVH
jgi:hypothetical protein